MLLYSFSHLLLAILLQGSIGPNFKKEEAV